MNETVDGCTTTLIPIDGVFITAGQEAFDQIYFMLKVLLEYNIIIQLSLLHYLKVLDELITQQVLLVVLVLLRMAIEEGWLRVTRLNFLLKS